MIDPQAARMAILMSVSPALFISYSHKDEEYKDFVVSHLKVLERQGVFDVWDDRRIKGGGNWQTEIDAALDRADIAILLISRHFLTSDFIMDHEVQAVLHRHASQDVIPYPLLISDCAWTSIAWLRSLNLRPTDARPLNSFPKPERDQVMTDIAEEIAGLLSPWQDQAGLRSSIPNQKHISATQGGIFAWWRNASVTARATVLGTVFAGLGLIWSMLSGFTNGDQITAECSAVNTGSVESSEINVDC